MIVSRKIAFIIPVIIVILGGISLAYSYDIQKQNCEKYRMYIERILTGIQNASSTSSTLATVKTHNLANDGLIRQYNVRCASS